MTDPAECETRVWGECVGGERQLGGCQNSYSSKASDGGPGGYNWSVPLRVAAGSEQVSFKNRLQGLHHRILYPDHSSYDSQAETIAGGEPVLEYLQPSRVVSRL